MAGGPSDLSGIPESGRNLAKVLVVDDDPVVLRMVSRIVQSAGYDVVEATNGIEGMEAMREHHPDLVITDIIMPLQEGIETIRQIRKTSSLPIIAMSGSPKSDLYDRLVDARLLGADMTLRKPFTRETLLAAVQAMLPPSTPAPAGQTPNRDHP